MSRLIYSELSSGKLKDANVFNVNVLVMCDDEEWLGYNDVDWHLR